MDSRSLLLLLASMFGGRLVLACSEAHCASVVSKCMLIGSCNCTITPEVLQNRNCTCCQSCQRCLHDTFDTCCSCVGMCKPPKDINPSLILKSVIEDLDDSEDDAYMFDVLTEGPDTSGRWTAYTFPALDSLNATQALIDAAYMQGSSDRLSDHLTEFQRALETPLQNINCTVTFATECMPNNKCHNMCQSMGAAKYRWFHNGCCECVGHTCLNYGVRHARCEKCPDEPLAKIKTEL